MARSRPSVSAIEKQIRDIKSSDALLRGKIGDLRIEHQRSEEAVAKSKSRLEKLKKEKDALEVEKKDLQHQL